MSIFTRRENLCEPTLGDAPVDGGDVRRQGPVVAQKGGALSDPAQDFVETLAGFQRPPQVDTLGGGQKFDGDDLAGVPGDLRQAARRVAPTL